MESFRERIAGFPAATLWLATWLVIFSAFLPSLSGGGGTPPLEPRDLIGVVILLAGSYQAAGCCRFLPLFFAFGSLGGCMYACNPYLLAAKNPITMSLDPTLWTWYFVQQTGLCVGLGMACCLVAALRHRRIDSAANRRAGRCRKCGYLLYGLTEPRCPECGEPFDPSRLAGVLPGKEDTPD
jgi:hypothetical protein